PTSRPPKDGGMMKKCSLPLLVILVLLVATAAAAQQKTILFDAAHAQTAGNADWTLDEDSCGIAQRFPTPDQAGITSSTAETYWNGANSAMGADRNSDGIDAAGVFNALMGSPSIFGITYNDNSADKTFGWFDDHPDVNYTTDTTSAIIWAGAFGVPSSTKGLGLFGSSSMTLS